MKHPSYQERTLRAVSVIFTDALRGTVSHIHVRHDEGCPMLAGAGICRCVPDIELRTPAGNYLVDLQGIPHPLTDGGAPIVPARHEGRQEAVVGVEP